MFRIRSLTTLLQALLFCALSLLLLHSTGEEARAANKKLPPLTDVLAYVDREFAASPENKPGDIISQGQVEPLFKGLEQMGWVVPDQKAILGRVPVDNDYVVKQLRTEQGRKFMHQISRYPEAYDRLYHLVVIPLGRQQVHDLIRVKDGYRMIEYMTTTKLGENLGKQLSNSPRGKDFNKPTGKIFTVEALKAELSKSYAVSEKAAAAPQAQQTK